MARKYYAQKDELGFPIPSTMMSVETPLYKLPEEDNIVEIPAETKEVLPGQTETKHPGGLRYFVRKDQKGTIIPNSLLISYKKPEGLVYEFKLITGVGQTAPSIVSYSQTGATASRFEVDVTFSGGVPGHYIAMVGVSTVSGFTPTNLAYATVDVSDQTGTFNVWVVGLPEHTTYYFNVFTSIDNGATWVSSEETQMTTLYAAKAFSYVINAGDLALAIGNTDTAKNGKVYADTTADQNNTAAQRIFSSAGSFNHWMCSKVGVTPTLGYWASDVFVTSGLASTQTDIGNC